MKPANDTKTNKNVTKLYENKQTKKLNKYTINHCNFIKL